AVANRDGTPGAALQLFFPGEKGDQRSISRCVRLCRRVRSHPTARTPWRGHLGAVDVDQFELRRIEVLIHPTVRGRISLPASRATAATATTFPCFVYR